MAPEQYEANVHTRKGSDAVVEFAVKLPGRDDAREFVYLPIDAKFPKDVYEQLLDAYDAADSQAIETAGKLLETTIKKMAKDISDKYLALPPRPISALCSCRSRHLRRGRTPFRFIGGLATKLQGSRNRSHYPSGHTKQFTNGLPYIGDPKALREVWTILGAVKKEFEKVGGMLEKAQKNLQTASGQIEEVLGTRTRAIQRKLKDVDTLSDREARAILPEIGILTEEDEKTES